MFPELCAMINSGSGKSGARKGVGGGGVTSSGLADKECVTVFVCVCEDVWGVGEASNKKKTARVQLTVHQVSPCCHGAASVTDRWVCW